MNGAHDMGGLHGFGPVLHDENEPIFDHEWEGRVFGIRVATEPLKLFETTDQLRFAIERLSPAQYLSSSYYELRLIAIEQELLNRGLITEQELDERTAYYRAHPDALVPRREDPESNARTVAALYARPPEPIPPTEPPRFRVGDRVRARNIHPDGHTRLPRYVRGRQGVVERVHAAHGLPDLVAARLPAEPMVVYGVRFTARELWGDSADPNSTLSLDLWESYLEPA